MIDELEENLRRAYAGFAAGTSVMPPATARRSVAVSLAAEQSWLERRPVDLAPWLASDTPGVAGLDAPAATTGS